MLDFFRGNEIPDIPECLMRRDLFPICGKLIGHYPIAGWLRVSCSYIKRTTEGSSWDDYVGDRTVAIVMVKIAANLDYHVIIWNS